MTICFPPCGRTTGCWLCNPAHNEPPPLMATVVVVPPPVIWAPPPIPTHWPYGRTTGTTP